MTFLPSRRDIGALALLHAGDDAGRRDRIPDGLVRCDRLGDPGCLCSICRASGPRLAYIWAGLPEVAAIAATLSQAAYRCRSLREGACPRRALTKGDRMHCRAGRSSARLLPPLSPDLARRASGLSLVWRSSLCDYRRPTCWLRDWRGFSCSNHYCLPIFASRRRASH